MLSKLKKLASTRLRSGYNLSIITGMPDPDDPEPDENDRTGGGSGGLGGTKRTTQG